MSVGAAIAGKQNRYMRRFEDAGVTDAAGARTLEELGCRPSFVFRGLVRRRVFVEAPGNRFYIDLERAEAFRSRRQLVLLVALGLAVVTLLFFIWTR